MAINLRGRRTVFPDVQFDWTVGRDRIKVKPKKYVWVGTEITWDFISGGSKDSKCIPFEDTNKKK